MLIDLAAGFIFIAGLRTGSTSIERMLGPGSHVCLDENRFGKHMSLAQVEADFSWVFNHRKASEFEVFGVIRDPAEHLASLYRFHQKPAFDGEPHSTRGVDFRTFLDTWIPKAWHTRPQIDRFLSPRSRFERVRLWNFRHIETMERMTLTAFRPKATLRRINYSPEDVPPPDLDEVLRGDIAAVFPRDFAMTRPDILYTWIDPRSGRTIETARA